MARCNCSVIMVPMVPEKVLQKFLIMAFTPIEAAALAFGEIFILLFQSFTWKLDGKLEMTK